MRNHRLVYSDEIGKVCPECSRPLRRCVCQTDGRAINNGCIRVERQTKGRKGKGVSLITGLDGTEIDIKALAKELKQRCGCGGTVKNGIIEIQTDQRDLLVSELDKRGLRAKKAGG